MPFSLAALGLSRKGRPYFNSTLRQSASWSLSDFRLSSYSWHPTLTEELLINLISIRSISVAIIILLVLINKNIINSKTTE